MDRSEGIAMLEAIVCMGVIFTLLLSGITISELIRQRVRLEALGNQIRDWYPGEVVELNHDGRRPISQIDFEVLQKSIIGLKQALITEIDSRRENILLSVYQLELDPATGKALRINNTPVAGIQLGSVSSNQENSDLLTVVEKSILDLNEAGFKIRGKLREKADEYPDLVLVMGVSICTKLDSWIDSLPWLNRHCLIRSEFFRDGPAL